jgi:hypothetical protein
MAYEVANEVGTNEVANAYKLALCEVFHPDIHGLDENSNPQIHSQFLVYTLIDLEDFYSNAYLSEANSLRRYRRAAEILHGSQPHPTLRAYHRVNQNHLRIEIIQVDMLSGQEQVAYLKTFWVRIIQRRWKKIYKARKDLLKQRMQIASLRERERTGKWPRALRTWLVGFT